MFRTDILWIDPKHLIADSATLALAHPDYIVRYSNKMDDALSLLRTRKPDLIIIEPAFFGEDDDERLDAVMELQMMGDYSGPIIVLTVLAPPCYPNLMRRLSGLGVDRILQKPIRPSELCAIVATVLADEASYYTMNRNHS